MTYPTLRLKPKTDARKIRWGAPWVYQDQLVLDRRSKALAAGTIAVLEDAERKPLGLCAVNTGSKISARILDRDAGTVIDADWFHQKLAAALAHRDRLYDAPFYRLVHAEGDGLPGIIIDRFGETAVLQPNAAYAEVHLDVLLGALAALPGIKHIYKNASGRTRGLEGLDAVSDWLQGGSEGPIPVVMNGATYLADVTGGQKTGLFFDQRENHRFAASLAGGEVLDVFSHVGGFGLAMLAGGADKALAVDASEPALALAQGGAEAMGRASDFDTLKGDAFDVLESLGAEGRLFDVVICDPPAFAPSKPARDAGLRAYERIARLAAKLVKPGGYLGLCSCSHAADLAAFRTASLRGIGRAGRSAQVIHTGQAGPDHPVHPYLAENDYLKAVFLRMVG